MSVKGGTGHSLAARGHCRWVSDRGDPYAVYLCHAMLTVHAIYYIAYAILVNDKGTTNPTIDAVFRWMDMRRPKYVPYVQYLFDCTGYRPDITAAPQQHRTAARHTCGTCACHAELRLRLRLRLTLDADLGRALPFRSWDTSTGLPDPAIAHGNPPSPPPPSGLPSLLSTACCLLLLLPQSRGVPSA